MAAYCKYRSAGFRKVRQFPSLAFPSLPEDGPIPIAYSVFNVHPFLSQCELMTTYIRNRFFVSCSIILLSTLTIYGQEANEKLLTVAEKSNFEATSSHAEVVALCKELANASPRVKYSEFGTTTEGRHLPLLVIADPPLETPEEAKKTGKTIVLVFANIHAGEVDGKEGVLILARELALAKDVPLFKNVV